MKVFCATFLLFTAAPGRDLVRIPQTQADVTDPATGISVGVTVGEFMIAPAEVTQAEYETVAGNNPAFHSGAERPVENVSWWDAIRYCNLRSARDGLEPCYDLATGQRLRGCNGYRLPTNAEWQTAAGKGDRESAHLGAANTKNAAELLKRVERGTRPVAASAADSRGLHDMYGNVWEWCEDWFDPVGSPFPATNPRGPDVGLTKVMRGGSFISTTGSWARGYSASMKPDQRSRFTGFRVVRSGAPVAPVPVANWREPYQRVPSGFEKATGGLGSVLGDLSTEAAWRARREEIRQKWLTILGAPKIAPPRPETRLVRTVEEPTYTGHLLELRTEPDSWEKIYVLTPREQVRKPRPVVIVAYYDVDTPAGRNLGGRAFLPMGVRSHAHLAVQLGYIAVAVRWFGESYGERYDEAVANLHLRHPGVTGMGKWIWDAQRLLDWLHTRPEVDRQNIGIIGQSLGGKMSLYAAAFEPRITAVVSSEPGIGLSFSNYEDYWYLGENIRKLHAGADHHELLALIAPRPFLLIGGQSADKDESWHYINAARPVYRLLGHPDEIGFFNHRTGHAMSPESVRLSLEWFKRYLGAPGA
jgi:dienelactone hydrolase